MQVIFASPLVVARADEVAMAAAHAVSLATSTLNSKGWFGCYCGKRRYCRLGNERSS